jgi:hypothetical protein
MRRGLVLLSLVITVVPAWTATAQPPPVSFSRDPGDYLAGASPVGVVAADFTNDGKADVASANGDSDDVTLLLGNGDGTFSDIGALFDVGLTPLSIAYGDLNGDGRLDIVTANEIGNTISTLLNEGNGVFSEAIETDTGTSPESIVLADLDGDGILDAATADNFDDTVTILKGVGDGSFTILDVVAAGAAPAGLAAADLNGDGRVDLVVTNMAGGPDQTGSVTVIETLEGGGFRALEEIPIDCNADGCSPVAVAIGAFDAGSTPDLAVVNEEGESVSILLGNGDLTFTPGVTVPVGSFPEDLAVADFNGDGKLDIATTINFDDNVVVLVGVGDGTFLPQPETVLAQDAAAGATTLVLQDANRFPTMGTVLVGEVLAGYDGKVGNVLNLVAPLEEPASAQSVVLLFFPVGSGVWGIASADFNGDGKPDLVTANQDDETVSILLNTSGAVSACVGDCDDNGEVTVDDIIKMVNIALGVTPIADCLAGDANGDGEITIDDILVAVNNALNNCPVQSGSN